MFPSSSPAQASYPQRLAISSRCDTPPNTMEWVGMERTILLRHLIDPMKLLVLYGIFSCPDQYLKSNPKASSPYEWQYIEPRSIKLGLAIVIRALPTYTIPCDNRSGIIPNFSPAYESATVAHHRTCALALVGEEFFWRSLQGTWPWKMSPTSRKMQWSQLHAEHAV